MSDNLNPQAREMADESMVRNLEAQADAIWPQEQSLFDRYALPAAAEILDAGCGIGAITRRLAERFPRARLVGVDVIDEHLDRARQRCAAMADRVRFEHRDIFALGLPAATFDLVVCRHVLQAIPHPERALAELVRVTRPGGWIHLIAEDYLMIHFEPRRLDADDFWASGPRAFGDALGTDLRIGRRAYGLLRRLGLTGITVDYVVVDPLRVPRETFAAIWRAWRDGYADAVSTHTPISRDRFLDHFNDMIATIEDPSGYGVWHVPVVAAQVP
jgi:SAM-dependent methyltransferase